MSRGHPPVPADTVVVVTGHPRSGTSLVMQMLAAGGVPVFTDDVRPADAHNPQGYFEHAAVLGEDVSWVEAARGHAVKVVHPHLLRLPRGPHYLVIETTRPASAVLESQAAMQSARHPDAQLASAEVLERAMRAAEAEARVFMARRGGFESIRLSHPRTLAHPDKAARRISAFLGGGLDEGAMARVVRPDSARTG